jgi:hypothetical protein
VLTPYSPDSPITGDRAAPGRAAVASRDFVRPIQAQQQDRREEDSTPRLAAGAPGGVSR